MFRLRGKVEVNPTEDLEKVKEAVERLFGNLEYRYTRRGHYGTLHFTSSSEDSLSKFKRVVRQDLIRDAVRSYLKAHVENGKLKFYLNKQVAYAGHVSLCEPVGESPLGPIEVEVECDDPHALVNWLTEK